MLKLIFVALIGTQDLSPERVYLILNASPAVMANIIRSPKSGSDWTVNDLIAYNIWLLTY